MVFISRGAVCVALYPADRGIFQVHDHRTPGGKLVVQLFQALGAGAGVPRVAAADHTAPFDHIPLPEQTLPSRMVRA